MNAPPLLVAAHEGSVGGLAIRRALPARARRMVGPWCFLDHLGPAALGGGTDLRVAPHPHIGLQTFSWMIEGEILHRDSLGSEQVIRPGEVNLMTAGHGIAHSEEALPGTTRLHMAQLWIALPDAERDRAPAFSHHSALPVADRAGVVVTVLAGSHAGLVAPGRFHSPIVGLDVRAAGAGATELALDPAFEHAVLPVGGRVCVDGTVAGPGEMLCFAPGRASLSVSFGERGHVLLIGGAPFGEPVLLWWNFVGRDPGELREAGMQWNAGHERFGQVRGYEGAPIAAPEPPRGRLSN